MTGRTKAGTATQSDDYTDYNYNVQVRIDSDTGAMTVFCFGSESGEIGKPIHGGTDQDIAHSLGLTLIEDARREEHGWEPERTLDETRPADTAALACGHAVTIAPGDADTCDRRQKPITGDPHYIGQHGYDFVCESCHESLYDDPETAVSYPDGTSREYMAGDLEREQ